MRSLTREEILSQRLTKNGLTQPFTHLHHLLPASLGIQSQYLHHGLFNIASRVDLSNNQDISNCLSDAILAWGQRQTYHFYDKETWQKMCHFLAEERLWVPSYFDSENLDLATASQDLKKRLNQPRLRSQLVQDYGAAWSKLFLWSALFLYHSRQGQLYHRWLPHDRMVEWQSEALPVPENLSKELLESYFSFYGPASLADAAHFFGIRQHKIAPSDLVDLDVFEYQGKTYYAKDWQDDAKIPEVVLLGKFDPLLVSYKHKDILIDPNQQSSVWKKAGQISALILIRGKMRGTWTMSVNGQNISFKVVTNQKLSQRQQARTRRIFRDYARWIHKTIKIISFELA